jgi:hypothetical protein
VEKYFLKIEADLTPFTRGKSDEPVSQKPDSFVKWPSYGAQISAA